MKKFKGFLTGLICGVVLMISIPVAAKAGKEAIEVVYKNIKLEVNGVQTKMPKGVEPFIYGGTTYLPVRAVAEALGEKVNYDSESATVKIGNSVEKPISKSTDEAIKKITDEEIKQLISEGVDNLVDFYYSGDDKQIIGMNDSSYFTIKPELDSYEKIQTYLGSYFSTSMQEKVVGAIVYEKENVLYIQAGDIGIRPDYKTLEITKRVDTQDSIMLETHILFSNMLDEDGKPDFQNNKYLLKYENGKWLIDDISFI